MLCRFYFCHCETKIFETASVNVFDPFKLKTLYVFKNIYFITSFRVSDYRLKGLNDASEIMWFSLKHSMSVELHTVLKLLQKGTYAK